MKIKINEVRETPSSMDFSLCIYGHPSERIQEWCNHHKLEMKVSGDFTNIIIPKDIKLSEIFECKTQFRYMDGFSPNTNKKLHVGHLSNLIIASALSSLGISKENIAILGDTVGGNISKEESLRNFHKYCTMFNYNVSEIFLASEMVCDEELLIEGTGEYEGTKVFNTGSELLVGIKSDQSTSYFYQDVALASHLNAPTLYLTGLEQTNHFDNLKKIMPNVNHIGLGLVTVNDAKMSTRNGNVILADEIVNALMENLKDEKLVANVISGQILKYNLQSSKNINMQDLTNPLKSSGLYLSYTMARLTSAGMIPTVNIININSRRLEFSLIKSMESLNPSIFFNQLVALANQINKLYATNIIKDNVENQKMFQPLFDDLILGIDMLGMHRINKV